MLYSEPWKERALASVKRGEKDDFVTKGKGEGAAEGSVKAVMIGCDWLERLGYCDIALNDEIERAAV